MIALEPGETERGEEEKEREEKQSDHIVYYNIYQANTLI
jgi:hypothetical protein